MEMGATRAAHHCSVSSSGLGGGANMTPNEAAKACMALVYERLNDSYYPSEKKDDEFEREFTEIISQACGNRFFDGIRHEQAHGCGIAQYGMQQARCPHCDCPLNGKHAIGCMYPHFQAQQMQNQPASYNPADLCNANPYREIKPIGEVIPHPYTTALADEIQRQMDENVRRANEIMDKAFHEGFPQEIEEPRPQSWWKRWFL